MPFEVAHPDKYTMQPSRSPDLAGVSNPGLIVAYSLHLDGLHVAAVVHVYGTNLLHSMHVNKSLPNEGDARPSHPDQDCAQ